MVACRMGLFTATPDSGNEMQGVVLVADETDVGLIPIASGRHGLGPSGPSLVRFERPGVLEWSSVRTGQGVKVSPGCPW